MRGDIDIDYGEGEGSYAPIPTSPGTGAGRLVRRRGEVYPRTHDMRTKAILLVMKIRRTHLF